MTHDIAIVGAGIAGATLAAELAPHARVLILEGESQPGYHSTGRSAAFWSETYGGAHVQPLTTASAPALAPFLQQLGAVHLGRADDDGAIAALLSEFDDSPVRLERVDPAAIVPGLRSEWTLGVMEASCAYIDVAALHAAALGEARGRGARLVTDAPLHTAERVNGRWRLETGVGVFEAAVLVDAAGAWADAVARVAGATPLGIRSYRRTLAQLRTDPAPPADLPLVIDINGGFYFKPESGGRLWLSPHDETPVDPHDVAPEEIDVAVAIDRFEQVVDWRVDAVERRWAGLRSFTPDRLPVYGFDPIVSDFFWCAGQGGFGIQTAPAAARLAASLLLGQSPDGPVAAIDPAHYAPTRFSR